MKLGEEILLRRVALKVRPGVVQLHKDHFCNVLVRRAHLLLERKKGLASGKTNKANVFFPGQRKKKHVKFHKTPPAVYKADVTIFSLRRPFVSEIPSTPWSNQASVSTVVATIPKLFASFSLRPLQR